MYYSLKFKKAILKSWGISNLLFLTSPKKLGE